MVEMIRSTIRGIRLASIALAGYWLILFVLTHLPKVPVPPISNVDKYIHFSAFAGLAFLLAWAIPTFPNKRWINVVLALVIAIVYGAIDEISQTPVGRTADVMDWAADSAGALIGVSFYVILRRIVVTLGKARPAEMPMTLEAPLA
jgi:VanZ family protein